jgi:radical SAM protein with 4Fe4S-binding SPASM domain
MEVGRLENNLMKRKKFIDPNIARKSKIYNASFKLMEDKVPLPAIIEISNSGVCNRECSFCPRSDPNYNHVNEFFSNDLHDKLCDELANFDFSGIFAYCGFNEPLIKKDIYRDIQYARKKLPKSKIEIVTNGDVLNEDKLKRLYDAGLTTILISVYDGGDAEKKFYDMCENLNLSKEAYIIRNRYKEAQEDFGLTLSNRAGNLENASFKVYSLKEALKKPCTYPSYMFFVDYNGDVLMCSHDWGKKLILGNLNKNSFVEIWKGKKSMFARNKLNNSDRHFSPCNKCDVMGDVVGSKHAEAWKN